MQLFLITASVGMALIALIASLIPSNHRVRHTKAMPIAGGVGAVGALLIALFANDNDAGLVLAALFLLISGILNIEYLTWHIDSDFLQDFFVVRSMLHKRTVMKSDVSGYTDRRNGGVLHLNNGRRVAANSVIGLENLIEDIESYQAERQNLKLYSLPDVPERLFRGYLKNPTDFIILFILLFCVFASCVFAPFWMMSADINLKDTDCVWVERPGADATLTEDGTVLFPGDDGSAYVCRFLRNVFDESQINAVIQKVNHTETVQLAIPAAGSDDQAASGRYSVREIICSNETLVSFEQTADGIKGEAWKISRVMLILLGIYFVFVCCFCIFVSNTPRYYKIVRLFVKKEYMNY